MFKQALLLITTAFSALTALSSANAEPLAIRRTIQLKPHAEVWSNQICLGDLVEDGWLKSRCAIDRNTCCRWSFNPDERIRSLSKIEIDQGLSGFNLGGIGLEIQGAREITVTKIGRELSAAEIGEKIKAALSARFAEKIENVSAVVQRIQGSPRVSFAEEGDWDVSLPEALTENAAIKVISTKEKTQTLAWVQARIGVESEVYVAKKMVRPGEALQLESFDLRKANVLPLQMQGAVVFKGGQFPAGVRARQTLLAGTPLNGNATEKIPLVKLGDTVTLILRSDSLRVSTKGIVQSTAGIGDTVTVQVSRYNRTFRGRLTDGRVVEVWL